MTQCIACGRYIIESRGCVRIERQPGKIDTYHPDCEPKETRFTENPRRHGKGKCPSCRKTMKAHGGTATCSKCEGGGGGMKKKLGGGGKLKLSPNVTTWLARTLYNALRDPKRSPTANTPKEDRFLSVYLALMVEGAK